MNSTFILRNKKVIKEFLNSKHKNKVLSVHVLKNLKEDFLTKEILNLAKTNNIRIIKEEYKNLPTRRSGKTKDVIYAKVYHDLLFDSLDSLLENVYKKEETPYFLLLNKVDINLNIATITRTAYAAGVNGVIFDGNIRDFLNDESVHISMGFILKIPIVNEKIYSAIKYLKKNKIKVFSLDTKGETYYNNDLTGPCAFVFGAEKDGLPENILSKTTIIKIPMKRDIDSLNVSSAASVVLFEKNRQDDLI